MKLLFHCAGAVRFTVETPERQPLGGSESCVAWLCRHLALLGHDVTLMCAMPSDTPARLAGVRHVPITQESAAFFAREDFEAIISVTAPQNAEPLRRVAPRACQIAWLHLFGDQAAMAGLHAAAPHVDCAVAVSDCHRRSLDFRGPIQVIGNAIAPSFEAMFDMPSALLAAKRNRAVYASIPDRGLDWLIEAWRQAQVDTKLDIYSGMAIYQRSDAPLSPLYAQIEKTPRARRHAPLGQRDLAMALRSAAFLTYPANEHETFCIVAQEAMAAGLKVVATEMGALPETTRGHADLMRLDGLDVLQVPSLFARRIEANVQEFLSRPEQWAEERFAQMQDVNRTATWRVRAKEWEAFLSGVISWKRGS
jgi:glycosyltransferase involved in cell wall biosynthesis